VEELALEWKEQGEGWGRTIRRIRSRVSEIMVYLVTL